MINYREISLSDCIKSCNYSWRRIWRLLRYIRENTHEYDHVGDVSNWWVLMRTKRVLDFSTDHILLWFKLRYEMFKHSYKFSILAKK